MLTKFDVRSSRVKGVSFHKQRPWVLCGLHNGVVQIWDYRMNTSVDTYFEHSGSVRGVDFHDHQPLFVTGADDYTVKVWNHKLRRCLFTLIGHVDYIRTTFFHKEQPWIVSSSDDFTIRVWNWQSRNSVACLPGHSHYVMCAQFHPTKDLLASASLDKTIRFWDISPLRLRRQEAGFAQDLLGTVDVMVKFQIDVHEKGVNWVAFHPFQNYIVSGADDRTVAVCSYSATGWYLEKRIRSHTANVCCVSYFKDYIISNSEDRTIRVFEKRRSDQVMIFRRDTDRYWVLATLPQQNLIAAGHDSGLQVFKLFRERPAFTMDPEQKTLYYVHERSLYVYNFETGGDHTVNIDKGYDTTAPHHLYPPRAISYNPGDQQLTAFYDGLNCVDLLAVPKPGLLGVELTLRTYADMTDAVFVGPNKFVYVNSNGQLCMQNLQRDKDKVLETNFVCSRVFPGPMGCVVCASEDHVYLYQVAQHGTVADAAVTGLRFVVWDKDYHKVAFVGKNTITVMTKRFRTIATVAESSVRMKSAAFDETRDVMYFTTANHLKYCSLRTGETSTISTLKNVVYLVRAVGDRIWVLSRGGKVFVKELDNLELNFKLKLQQQLYRDIIRIIQRKELKGQALVGYLHKHGHSEIALHFVTDPLTRFNLALECGAMDIAKTCAVELSQSSIWRRLADSATKFGDIQLAQFATAKAGNQYTGALLALVTGNMASLGHLIDTSTDMHFRLQNGLYAGDVKQRVQILAQAGQLPLAYTTARSNGLDEMADALLAQMDPEVAERAQAITFAPPLSAHGHEEVTPVTENWPMLQVEESVFSRLLKEPGQFDAIAEPGMDNEDLEAGAGWGEDDDDAKIFGAPADAGDADAAELGEGEGWDDDLDIDVSAAIAGSGGGGAAGLPGDAGPMVVPQEFAPVSQHWVDVYNLPAFHVAAGSFSTALDLLRSQIGLANPAPLRPHMLALWAAVNASRPTWAAPSALYSLAGPPPADEISGKSAPVLPDYMPAMTQRLQSGFQLFVEGRFADALTAFEAILLEGVVCTVGTEAKKNQLRELTTVAVEYTRALSLQLHMRGVDAASDASLELALYFTHFKLHRPHLILALSQAMTKAYKKKNFKCAASVARRLIEQDPPKSRAQQAAAIIAEADRTPTDAVDVNYDERNPFIMCSVSYKPMYKGTVHPVRCSYCLSPAEPSFKGTACPVCKIARFGVDCAGLKNVI